MKKLKKSVISIIFISIILGATGYIFKEQALNAVKNVIGNKKSVTNVITNNEYEHSYGTKNLNSFDDFLSCNISDKTVIIFEPNGHHHECMPGYAKYFTDLGYKVDTLIMKNNSDSFELFNPEKKLRIFEFENLDEISNQYENISKKFNEYDYIFINTTDPEKYDIYEKLGILSKSNAIFVAHDYTFINDMKLNHLFEKNKVLTLGDFDAGLYVNPHYFGDINLKVKNKKTRFFVTSTSGRNYDNLVNAAIEMKKSNLDFEVIVTGRGNSFSEKSLPSTLLENFNFKHGVSYKEMYEEVEKSDYVIVIMDPNNPNDSPFKDKRVTGSTQLAYGFSKPLIIHEGYKNNYKVNSKNSFIYNDKNFTSKMINATKLTNTEYNTMQNKFINLSKSIYDISINNLKKALKN